MQTFNQPTSPCFADETGCDNPADRSFSPRLGHLDPQSHAAWAQSRLLISAEVVSPSGTTEGRCNLVLLRKSPGCAIEGERHRIDVTDQKLRPSSSALKSVALMTSPAAAGNLSVKPALTSIVRRQQAFRSVLPANSSSLRWRGSFLPSSTLLAQWRLQCGSMRLFLHVSHDPLEHQT